MKKLAFLLSVFVLLLATIPCCLADNCLNEEAATEQTNQKDTGSDTDCGLCSPFFSCHSCPGFAFTNQTAKVALIFFPVTRNYPEFTQHFFPQFAPSIWQPPKIA